MEWINIHVSVLDSVEFVGCEPVEQATWLKLLRFAVGQENGGVIVGCKGWKDRKWQQLTRCTKREVTAECDLWTWDGDDLTVAFYPTEKEAEVKAKRENGKRGGRPKKETETKPHGLRSDNLNGTTMPETAKTEGKGNKEGKIPPIPPEGGVDAGRSVDLVAEREVAAREIAGKVMSLKPGWAKPAAMTAAELKEVLGNLDALRSLAEQDWALVRRFLGARLPEGAAYWQPRNRRKFIETIADVLESAQRWEQKNRKPARHRAEPDTQPMTDEERAEALAILNAEMH